MIHWVTSEHILTEEEEMMATVQMKDKTGTYEQVVLTIMRRLPPYRVLELVDFARFLEAQTAQQPEQELTTNATEDAWERLLAKPAARRVLRDMAAEAREDYQAGRTTDIQITEDGELAPA